MLTEWIILFSLGIIFSIIAAILGRKIHNNPRIALPLIIIGLLLIFFVARFNSQNGDLTFYLIGIFLALLMLLLGYLFIKNNFNTYKKFAHHIATVELIIGIGMGVFAWVILFFPDPLGEYAIAKTIAVVMAVFCLSEGIFLKSKAGKEMIEKRLVEIKKNLSKKN